MGFPLEVSRQQYHEACNLTGMTKHHAKGTLLAVETQQADGQHEKQHSLMLTLDITF